MIRSIAAGFMIAVSALIYLVVGPPLGAFMFAFGLLSILIFQFSLFTGKAGLLATKEVRFAQLLKIWIGNFIGCVFGALLARMTPIGPEITTKALSIINVRIGNLWIENIVLGILCGIMMYVGVRGFLTAPYLTILSVAAFILIGANHCVADMAYISLAANAETLIPALAALLFTTLGNIIGTNIVPLFRIYSGDLNKGN